MNGAMAEPLVSTIRPPKITIMIRIGNSQNFLRSRMKAQSSTMMEPIGRCLSNSELAESELVTHRLRRRPWRRAIDPVALGRRIEPEAQEVLAHGAHDETDRHDGHEEQQPQYDGVHDLVEQQTELQPQPVERIQNLREGEGDDQEDGRQRQGPMPAAMAAPPRQHADEGEEAGEDQAKAAITAGFDMLFARIVLVKLAGRHLPMVPGQKAVSCGLLSH